MTVGEKVLDLRDRLHDLPVSSESHSFAGLPLYALGHDFFPAHIGLFAPSRQSISTIVLGSDWGNKASFERWLERKVHSQNPTTSRTARILEQAGIERGDCFYSNAWPLLRAGEKEQSFHPMREDSAATAVYRDYMMATITVLNPKLVITLGHAAAWFIAPLCGPDRHLSKLRSPSKVTIKDLDVEPLGELGGHVIVHLTHPSHWSANSPRRKLLPMHTDEISLLIHARREAGIPDRTC